jgi:hypothetical protein
LGERLDRTQEVAGSSPASSIGESPAKWLVLGGGAARAGGEEGAKAAFVPVCAHWAHRAATTPSRHLRTVCEGSAKTIARRDVLLGGPLLIACVGLAPMFDEAFWTAATPRQARDRLIEVMSYELLGPAAAEEILDENPLSRYLVGMLAPFGTEVAREEQEDTPGEDDGEDLAGAPEQAPPLSQALSPSSIGVSCLVRADATRVEVTVTWGEYQRVREGDEDGGEGRAQSDEESAETADQADDAGVVDAAKPQSSSSTQQTRRRRDRWRRIPMEPVTMTIELAPGDGLKSERVRDNDDIWVEHVARPLDDSRVALSVFLVNRRHSTSGGRPPADEWIFQPRLAVAGPQEARIFVPRELDPELARTDRDLEANALLYRNRREFGIGHGCACRWQTSGHEAAIRIETDITPRFELQRVDPRPIHASSLDMDVLARATSADEIGQHLAPIADLYADWIETKRREAQGLPETLRATGEDHMRHCEEALTRIQDAIELLRSNPDARAAFNFANRAMLLQRSHTEWSEARRRDPATATAAPEIRGEWRPFQLAFILLTLRGIVEPRHADRALGDLLWFPTAGGKTEAYLGLTAFTLAMRRLARATAVRTDVGVTVLMRYTLRLLTIQQFQRAAALICACEALRREDTQRWGSHRFSIGLWLGRQATPNTHDGSRHALDLLRAGEQPDENPCQLEACPWCGETLTHDNYDADRERCRTVVRCPRADCEFSENASSELPVLLVDEEIYRECPSMLIATVDKFAQMPWNGEVAAVFGRVDRECRRCGFLTPDSKHPAAHRVDGARRAATELVVATEPLAPPDLIIQDELHLISGPLGTMVGLYETAVNALSARASDGSVVYPKVVASTATVRRAFEQVQALFARQLRVFPPLALEPEDSFFAVETPVSDEAPGRLYVGIMAPGKSMKTALVRVCSALLSAAAGLRSQSAERADPYLTLVAYFNSLRELGGAVRLMEDDIPARLRQLESRGLPQRNKPIYEELTSRVRSDRIPFLLRRLKTPYDAPRAEDEPLPLDAILASNMISVGVDVDRLGLMTVLGQPKTTAEYIQATSRVGRQPAGPGLVVTIYNWVRPRDLSHYERFGHYHATLYRHVEAVSVTPYSSRARDRGLAGAFVALTRLRDERLDPEEGAGLYDADDESVEMVVRAFRDRAEQIADDAVADEVERGLRAYIDQWDGYARSPLRYGWRPMYDENKPPPSDVLLRPAEGGRFGRWRTPGSLREVEETSRIYVRELDGHRP